MTLRHLAVVALLAVALPMAAAAEDLPTLILPVGATHVVGGWSGRCDDLSVASISLDQPAKVTGLKVGSTTCSAQLNGGRRVFKVVVEAPKPGSPGAPTSR